MKMTPAMQLLTAVGGAAITAYLAEMAVREREREAYADGLLAGQAATGPHLVPSEHPSQFVPDGP